MKLITCLFLIALTGCSIFKSSVCDVGKKVVDSSSAVIATALVCKNQSAIKSDLEKMIEKVGVCKTPTNQMLDLCTVISAGAVNLALGAGIPAAWQCEGGIAKNVLQTALEAACHKVLP